ncbi:MAG: FecR domain-containing protein [Chloroflexota bacterium]
MQSKLSKAFGECLARIKGGEVASACLAEYPKLRQRLVPLLYTTLAIQTVPKTVPSEEFRQQSRARLVARLRQRFSQTERSRQEWPAAGIWAALWRGLVRAFSGPARVAIPLTLALILAVQALFLFGAFNVFSPSQSRALASQATLDAKGSVELRMPGSTVWQDASDGMTLNAGSRIRTAPDAQAVLTFFNGTTITLEPGTDLVVETIEFSTESKSSVLVFKQWIGKTWSRVEKLADPGSRYEIQTPSAIALVRGTLFATDVDESGATTIETREGLVSVSSQGREVYVAPGQQTTVEFGVAPADPAPVSQNGADQVQQSNGSLPAAPEASSGEPPHGLLNGLPWEGGQDTWLLALVIGALVLSLGVTVYMWRKH